VTILGFLFFFGGPLAILVPVFLIYALPVILLYLVIPAFVAAALADLGFRALGAERTRLWLVAGTIAAFAITIIWMQVVFPGGLLTGSGAILEYALEYAVLALVPVSTALTWWSYLPIPPTGYAETFE
jgi:hypothetical protein